jgi:hypothetical protein
MTKRVTRLRRSAGTMMPLDLVRNRMRAPSRASMAADIEAVDRGEGRTIACMFRGTYGAYPRRFKAKMLEVTTGALALRPFWCSLNRKHLPITESVLSAKVRPRDFKTDWNIKATGVYAAGSRLEWAGCEVVSCQTSVGTLEFAVPRPDVPLMLHVLRTVLPRSDTGPGNLSRTFAGGRRAGDHDRVVADPEAGTGA